MIVYQTPSTAAFQSRRQFHATHKTQSETIPDWFKRLQHLTSKCEFENVSDYMLIDKFISGLNDNDFNRLSQVAAWTTEEMVLVVIGNSHIFRSTAATKEDESRTNDFNHILSLQTKTKRCVGDSDEAIPDDGGDSVGEEVFCDFTKSDDAITIVDTSVTVGKKKERNNSERAKRHIELLKEKGRYEEYKKKKAECAKNRRLKNKQNEQYLPPELQMHLMNERRLATRKRVKRWRDRKQHKSQDGTDIIASTDSPWEIDANVDKIENEHDAIKEIKMGIEEVSIEQLDSISTESEHDHKPEIDYNYAQQLDPESEIKNQLPAAKRTKRITRASKVEKSYGRSTKKFHYLKKTKQLECYMCMFICKTLYELKGHLSIFHPLKKREQLICPHCPKTTISREVLSRHLKKSHSSMQVHKCPCCDDEFTKRGQLRDHLAVHPDYRPYICETCGNGFRTINELNSHSRKHTGEKPFKCGVCDLDLGSRSSFRSHLLRHTGERPYPCKLCEKEFRQLSSLRKHLISIHHQGEKPYLCITCNKRFASIYHLRIHANVHTGDRPYTCNYCGNTFSQPSALKAHRSRIHENEQRIQNAQQMCSS